MAFETYLRENGYKVRSIECMCPHCVTVAEFVQTHPKGKYILICQDGIVPILDGICFVSDNLNDEIVLYYYEGGN